MKQSRLLVLMYHQIYQASRPKNLAQFFQHIEYLAAHYPIVAPQQPLEAPLSICLTFDDAYADFYFHIFPFLQAAKLPCVLGIPTAYIPQTASVTQQTRLNVDYPLGLAVESQSQQPLCSWQEIRQMVDSGWVTPASHSHTHPNLTSLPSSALEEELLRSKHLLEQELQHTVSCFIYPYGRTNRAIQRLVQKHYPISFRIGSAINHSWRPLLYRVDAATLWPRLPKLLPLQFKYYLNRLRGL